MVIILLIFRDNGALSNGDRVLVIGASGGCGISAIQLAKAMGAGDIVGVCSGKNAEFVKSQGATDVIDYTKHDIVAYYRNKDGNIEVTCHQFRCNVNQFA